MMLLVCMNLDKAR